MTDSPSPSVRSRSTIASVASTYSRQNRPPREHRSPSRLANAIGRVANPVLDGIDVNGVLDRIEFNDIVDRIDWNAIVDDIDWNNLLDKIDLDALIDKVDINRAVDRLDVNAVLDRSNLKQIIARSTSGMCSIALNRFRAICIKIDQILQRTGRCAWCMCCCPKKQRWILPPRPTVRPLWRPTEYKEDRALRESQRCPKKSTDLATAVQGRNAGTFTRFLAYGLDKLLTLGCALLLMLIVTWLIDLFQQDDTAAEDAADALAEYDTNSTISPEQAISDAQQQEQWEDDEILIFGIALPFFIVNCMCFVVDALSMAAVGRTVFKSFMGLVVVDSRNEKVRHITFCQAICRSFLTNFINVLVWIGTPISLFREDRRGIIDLMCGTTVIYAWDAHSFQMASAEYAKESPYGDMDFESLVFDRFEEDEPPEPPAPERKSIQMSAGLRQSSVKSRAVSRISEKSSQSEDEDVHWQTCRGGDWEA